MFSSHAETELNEHWIICLLILETVSGGSIDKLALSPDDKKPDGTFTVSLFADVNFLSAEEQNWWME